MSPLLPAFVVPTISLGIKAGPSDSREIAACRGRLKAHSSSLWDALGASRTWRFPNAALRMCVLALLGRADLLGVTAYWPVSEHLQILFTVAAGRYPDSSECFPDGWYS